MNSTKLQNGMDTTFMTSENSKTSDPHKLLLNLTEKIEEKINMLLSQTWVFNIHKKNEKVIQK